MAHHYEALGLVRGSTDANVRAAFLQAARRLHPDRSGGATAEFQAVQRAYEVLSDPEQRRAIDVRLDGRELLDTGRQHFDEGSRGGGFEGGGGRKVHDGRCSSAPHIHSREVRGSRGRNFHDSPPAQILRPKPLRGRASSDNLANLAEILAAMEAGVSSADKIPLEYLSPCPRCERMVTGTFDALTLSGTMRCPCLPEFEFPVRISPTRHRERVAEERRLDRVPVDIEFRCLECRALSEFTVVASTKSVACPACGRSFCTHYEPKKHRRIAQLQEVLDAPRQTKPKQNKPNRICSKAARLRKLCGWRCAIIGFTCVLALLARVYVGWS